MSCEINDNPCETCEEPYCPDQLADVCDDYYSKRIRIECIEKSLVQAKAELLIFEKDHKYALELNNRLHVVPFTHQ